VAIDVLTPDSPGWWLRRLYLQLLEQRAYCQQMMDRFAGDAPLPTIADNQKDAVRWFVSQSRTNFERLIVNSVLSRLRIKGIRTKQGPDDRGDADAMNTWRNSRGKLWSHDAHRMALAMSRSFVIVGKDKNGKLLVTAEDPRQVTAITDPENPYEVRAGLKVFYDHVEDVEKCYLYLPGSPPLVATRKGAQGTVVPSTSWFHERAFDWVASTTAPEFDSDEFQQIPGTGDAPWLQKHGTLGDICPIVPFINEDGLSEFEPFIPQIDRINQQILQRMTIATIQAFKQRAMKGLPQKDPSTGADIDYDSIFVADPGAIWNIPASVEIWESGQVDLQPILLAIRDDIRDLAATAGVALYHITPDAANGSAEGASLQREAQNFRVQTRQDRFEEAHKAVCELIFRTLGDDERAEPGTIDIMWAAHDQPSMAERASSIAQTTGVISRYQQCTEIWGMDPDEAERNLVELRQDFILDMQFAAAAAPAAPQAPAPPGGAGTPAVGGGGPGANNPQNQAAAATGRANRVAKQKQAATVRTAQRKTAKAAASGRAT
jgi:hypothetical protein